VGRLLKQSSEGRNIWQRSNFLSFNYLKYMA
jgi:hypothetical protein